MKTSIFLHFSIRYDFYGNSNKELFLNALLPASAASAAPGAHNVLAANGWAALGGGARQERGAEGERVCLLSKSFWQRRARNWHALMRQK